MFGDRPGEQGLRGRGGWMLVVGNGTDSVAGVTGHSEDCQMIMLMRDLPAFCQSIQVINPSIQGANPSAQFNVLSRL